MKPLTFIILRMLSDGNYHSGTVLGKALQVSRASISNALRDLDRYGLVIHRVTGKGYRWLNPVQWLELDQIRNHLEAYADNFRITLVDCVESTNSILLRRASEQAFLDQNQYIVLATEFQANGRGRRGRAWFSGLGDSLTFSVLWSSPCTMQALGGLSLAAGIAVVRALTAIGIPGISLKWPNDILHNFHKLGGVLIELHGDMLSPVRVVIGIGLNVNMTDPVKHQIDQAVVDLASIVQSVPDRNRLLATLLLELTTICRLFAQRGFAPFREEWIRYHAYHHQSVRADFPDGRHETGIVSGVAADGTLLLDTPAGQLQLRSGELSLRRLS
ncbi:MAG: biotin--[acetyl-CoA-carboxylase] ligase [Nitrosomonas sp.]|nr:biotin--[acetyl-CoA-carboxylase] ligase [Nitrosomonas sp.]